MVGVVGFRAVLLGVSCPPLAWRGCPDEVKPSEGDRCRVGLDEGEGVARLRLDIDADHIEPGAMQSHRCATGTAEQV
jgi:hypothetical protein